LKENDKFVKKTTNAIGQKETPKDMVDGITSMG
jgi:hypothetical protein